MYHRLVLSAAFCLNILSFCLFWGTWAIPVGTSWAVGASGNNNTCTAQGLLYDWTYVAFPFYYASFSVLALVSVKHNFKEEKYAWIEKWIHLGAYIPPSIFVIYAAVADWIKPGVAICSFRYYYITEDDEVVPRKLWHVSPIAINSSFFTLSSILNSLVSHVLDQSIIVGIQFVELLAATITICYLWFNFTKIQSSIDAAIGMTRIREEARKQRTRDVAIQSGIYLSSFWFMYIANIVAMMMYYLTDRMPYNAQIVANVITGTQGIVLLVVYYGVVKQSDSVKLPTRVHPRDDRNETVSKIRANAANQSERPRLSLTPISFRIFDGIPAEDSPWAAFLEDDIESFDGDEISSRSSETVGTSNRAAESDLTASLLSCN